MADADHALLVLSSSRCYPGTVRKVWAHVPAGHEPATPAAVFVEPGVFPDVVDPDQRKNRNTEYDAFDDRYATFLLDEVLPLVQQRWTLSDDSGDWAICGGSSGGNCAFTAAWLRPDRFGKAIAFLSSFAQMPGGNPYPRLIPATEPKPLRILLQAGHRDLHWNEPAMNWLANNLCVAAALAEGGYDFRLVLGDGGAQPQPCRRAAARRAPLGLRPLTTGHLRMG